MDKNTKMKVTEEIMEAAVSPPEHEGAFEEWSSAGIGNAFLFGKVMTSNPDLLLELLQYSLPEFHIMKIEGAMREVDVKLSVDSHGVRLDILAVDDKGRKIDVEMQMRNEKNIPRRNAKWRKEYMDWEMTLRNEREKGREEERARTEEQRKRADAEKERADTEKKRADDEKKRADAAEEEIRRLKEQIEKIQNNK